MPCWQGTGKVVGHGEKWNSIINAESTGLCLADYYKQMGFDLEL
ncbi:hypothetical protein QA601_08960 [Chitinispirillales bacterium ANBcel5]|nr:hypothetical protein [Chitinispirillales bacterium ANBcel5]